MPNSRAKPRRVIAVCGVAGALSAGGIGAGLVIGNANRSPVYAAPKAVDLTIQVSAQRLRRTVRLSCRSGPAFTLAVPVKGPYAGNEAVVTGLPTRRHVVAGELLAEVSGRPVLVFPGRFQAYRDLTAGDSGPDVLQLQAALRSAGFPIEDRAGQLGPATARAIRQVYRRAGYTPLDQVVSTVADATSSVPPVAEPAAPLAKSVLLPRNETVFVPSLPVTVAPGSIRVGAEPTSTLLTLEGPQRAVHCRTDSAEDLHPGMTAELDTPAGPTGWRVARVVTPLPTALDQRPEVDLAGGAQAPEGDLEASVVATDTRGAVLTVPVAALGGSAEHPTVGVVHGRTVQPVEVRVGINVDGTVQVTPLDTSALNVSSNVTLSPYDR